jgi:urease accessory protein
MGMTTTITTTMTTGMTTGMSMCTAIPIPMIDRGGDADLLTLTQWLSPAFPVGGFAYSHGLEAVIAAGEVRNAAGLEQWLGDVIARGAGRADAVLLVAAMAGLAGLGDLARALAPSRERWEETIAQGRAFTEAVNALTGSDWSPEALPLAVGRAAATLSLSPERVAGLYLHAFASNLVSGAVRFIPLGQTDGQKVLGGLHPLILSVAGEAVRLAPEEITSGVPGADLAAMAHEVMDVRIFRT